MKNEEPKHSVPGTWYGTVPLLVPGTVPTRNEDQVNDDNIICNIASSDINRRTVVGEITVQGTD
jgi:hypothetical protein